MTLQETIIKEAKKLIGKKEIPQNQGFEDKELEREMIAIGWQIGWSWCVFAVKLIWFKSYTQFDTTMALIISHIFNSSAVDTFKLFKKAGWEISLTPKIGHRPFHLSEIFAI